MALAPAFSKGAAAAFAAMGAFSISFDHVHIVLVRPPSEVVIDTIIRFTPASQPTSLEFTIETKSAGEVFDGTMEYTDPALGVVFRGHAKVQSYSGDAAPAQVDLPIDYVGPGATVTRLAISPKAMLLTSPNVGIFAVQALDGGNNTVANTPIVWSVSDPTVATITADGTLTPLGKRGSVTVTARTPTNVTDNATATISLKPAGITVTAGTGQTGKVGTTLAQSGFVKVFASDQGGIQGVTVNFAAPAGGKVGTASAVTDANGVAFTTMTLGGAVGPQSFAASAAGFSTSIAATATVGDAAWIAPVSGSGQADTVYKTLTNELVVKVTDAFGNPVPADTVTWVRTAGSGAPSQPTSITNVDGLASVKYSLGAAPGIETIAATVPGVATPATFSAQAMSGTASSVTMVSGNGQTARAGQAFSAPLVVRALDVAGNPIVGATVIWSGTNATVGAATTSTDSKGVASNTASAGSASGIASVSASVSGRAVTFAETVQSGVVSKLAFTTQPANAAAGQLLPNVLVELDDAFGNRTAATNAVSVAIGTNPGNATLGGTLTRAAVNGVATFNDLTLNVASAGYTLVASSAGASGATSAPFSVGAGNAAAIVVVAGNQQSAPVNTAVAIAPQVSLVDANQNPVAGGLVTFTPANGSGTAAPATAISTTAGGLATLTSWTLGTVAGPQSLVVSSPGVPNVTMTATAQPGAPAKYIVTATPPSQIAGGNVSVFAQLVDVYSNSVPQSSRTVNWTSTNGGSYAQSSSSTQANGATTAQAFTTSTTAGVTHVLTATDGASPAISGTASISTIAGAAVRVALVTQPSAAVQSGIAFPQQPSVQLLDANSNLVTANGVTVTAAIVTGAGTLGGTLTATTTNGVATFTNLSITGVVGPRTLTFSAASLVSATSNSIAVGPGTPVALAFVQQPTGTTGGLAITPSITVAVRDGAGNTVTTATNPITFAIAGGSGTAGATLSGTLTQGAASGIATFANISVDSAGLAYRLVATSAGLTSATSANFDIAIGPVANVSIVKGNNQFVPVNLNSSYQPLVAVAKDAGGNAVSGASMVFTAGAGVTLTGPSTITTNAAGQASLSGFSLSGSVGGTTVTAAVGTPSATFTIQNVNITDGVSECKRATTGSVYCSGINTFGTLGSGSFAGPTGSLGLVVGGHVFSSMTPSGSDHQCGLVGTQAFCWGRNTFGELGDNTTTDRSQPVAVAGGLSFQSIIVTSATTCGLTTGGQLYCWGWAGNGLMADGNPGTIRTAPALVNTGGHTFTQVAATWTFACGIDATGALFCWGAAPSGTFLTATSIASPALASLTAGDFYMCGLTAAGAGYCWGLNFFGELGTGTGASTSTPTAVVGGLAFAQIRALGSHTCGVTTVNVAYCWGWNGVGQLGDSTNTNHTSPTAVAGGLRFFYIDGGNGTTTCATSTSLQPYCWGGGHGELGDGTLGLTTGPNVVTTWPGNASNTPNRAVPGRPGGGTGSPP